MKKALLILGALTLWAVDFLVGCPAQETTPLLPG
jgi:hypothetical protein